MKIESFVIAIAVVSSCSSLASLAIPTDIEVAAAAQSQNNNHRDDGGNFVHDYDEATAHLLRSSTPMHVIFGSIPCYGHWNPLRSIAKAVYARGHHASLLMESDKMKWCTEAKLEVEELAARKNEKKLRQMRSRGGNEEENVNHQATFNCVPLPPSGTFQRHFFINMSKSEDIPASFEELFKEMFVFTNVTQNAYSRAFYVLRELTSGVAGAGDSEEEAMAIDYEDRKREILQKRIPVRHSSAPRPQEDTNKDGPTTLFKHSNKWCNSANTIARAKSIGFSDELIAVLCSGNVPPVTLLMTDSGTFPTYAASVQFGIPSASLFPLSVNLPAKQATHMPLLGSGRPSGKYMSFMDRLSTYVKRNFMLLAMKFIAVPQIMNALRTDANEKMRTAAIGGGGANNDITNNNNEEKFVSAASPVATKITDESGPHSLTTASRSSSSSSSRSVVEEVGSRNNNPPTTTSLSSSLNTNENNNDDVIISSARFPNMPDIPPIRGDLGEMAMITSLVFTPGIWGYDVPHSICGNVVPIGSTAVPGLDEDHEDHDDADDDGENIITKGTATSWKNFDGLDFLPAEKNLVVDRRLAEFDRHKVTQQSQSASTAGGNGDTIPQSHLPPTPHAILRRRAQLEPSLAIFLNESPACATFGAVYVNFGTLSVLSDETFGRVLEALWAVPFCVVWKITEKERFNLVKSRIDQSVSSSSSLSSSPSPAKHRFYIATHFASPEAILEHDNTKVFISHCGDTSVLESIHALVPVAGIPIFADQPDVCQRIEESGIGSYIGPKQSFKVERLITKLYELGLPSAAPSSSSASSLQTQSAIDATDLDGNLPLTNTATTTLSHEIASDDQHLHHASSSSSSSSSSPLNTMDPTTNHVSQTEQQQLDQLQEGNLIDKRRLLVSSSSSKSQLGRRERYLQRIYEVRKMSVMLGGPARAASILEEHYVNGLFEMKSAMLRQSRVKTSKAKRIGLTGAAVDTATNKNNKYNGIGSGASSAHSPRSLVHPLYTHPQSCDFHRFPYLNKQILREIEGGGIGAGVGGGEDDDADDAEKGYKYLAHTLDKSKEPVFPLRSLAIQLDWDILALIFIFVGALFFSAIQISMCFIRKCLVRNNNVAASQKSSSHQSSAKSESSLFSSSSSLKKQKQSADDTKDKNPDHVGGGGGETAPRTRATALENSSSSLPTTACYSHDAGSGNNENTLKKPGGIRIRAVALNRLH